METKPDKINLKKLDVSPLTRRCITFQIPEQWKSQYYLYGLSEDKLVPVIEQHLEKGGIFVDIGANYGFYTVLAADIVGSSGKVIAFEPTPSSLAVLQENCRSLTNVTIDPRLIYSEEKKNVPFNDFGIMASPMNSMYSPRTGNKLQATVINVDAVSLDSYFTDHVPTMVKIDAEGAEYHVLKGMTRIIEDASPVITLEVGDFDIEGVPMSKDCIKFLLDKGYNVYQYENNNYQPHKIKEKYSYTNLVFVKKKNNTQKR